MSLFNFLEQTDSGVLIKVFVKPNQKKQTLFFSSTDAFLTIHIRAPPNKGKANKEVLKLLAKTLDIATGAITLRSGSTSRNKIFLVTSLSKEQILERFLPYQQAN